MASKNPGFWTRLWIAGARRAALPWTACIAGAVAILALAACGGGGSDGADGPAGPPGPPGPEGPPAPEGIGEYDPLPGVNVVITALAGGTGSGGNFVAGNVITATFTVKDDAGNDVAVPDLARLDFSVSGPTNNYQRVIASTNMLSSAVDLGGGLWSVTLPALPATYLAPLNDTTAIPTDTAHADPFGEWKGLPLDSGTYTVGIRTYLEIEYEGETFRDLGVGIRDFLVGSATVLAPRTVVGNDNCNACHVDLRAHGNGRKDVRLCLLCHTAGAEDRNTAGATPGVTIDFRVMIHKIHNGTHLPSVNGVSTNADGTRNYAATPVPYEIMGYGDTIIDFSGAVFPVWPNFNVAMPRDAGYSALASASKTKEGAILTGVTACAKCHGDPDGAGPLAAPANGGFAETNPSRQACGSCHDDIVWANAYAANGQTMLANFANDTCTSCHFPSGDSLAVRDGHLHPFKNPAVNPGVNVDITAVTGGTGSGGNFQTGDSPALTFTVRDNLGADVGLATLDSGVGMLLGSTANRQMVVPVTSANGQSISPFDFSGRLQAVSTSNRGSMSKVFLGPTAVQEVLTVQYTAASTFTVTGSASGALGTLTLPAATSTLPSGASLSALELGPTLGTETVTVDFTSSAAFTVTGSVSGVFGSGSLPAATSASTRFTSTNLSFTVTVGTTAMTGGTSKFRIGLFRGAPANPVLFAVVAGTSAFSSTAGAQDRFYYEVWPNGTSYTTNLPMDVVYEFLGDSTNAVGQVLTAGNLPVWFGRQQLWESATTTTTTTTTVPVASLGRSVAVAPATGFANNDVVVVEPTGGVGAREYVAIAPFKADGAIATTADATTTIYFKTPLRYAHAGGVSITKVTNTLKLEGATDAYLLSPALGTVTSNVAFTAGVGMVMSYRTHARFGWKRHFGDAFQAYYPPPANDSPDIGQEGGDWQGLPYQDGTYTVNLWLGKARILGLQNEVQSYNGVSNAGQFDVLYGTATTIEPRAVISSDPLKNCYTCHDDLIFHGGGRRGLDTCLTCHGMAGSEDKPRYDTPKVGSTTTDTSLTPGVAIEFRNMLHKIHMGEELAYGATWTVNGNQGTPHTYGEVVFPVMPGSVMQCVRCHGQDTWQEPVARSHTGAGVPVRTWSVVCGSCHDADDAQAHITSNVSGTGFEACAVCHGEGKIEDVAKVHIAR